MPATNQPGAHHRDCEAGSGISGLAETATANQALPGWVMAMKRSVIVSGTDSSMPTGPNIQPQNSIERNTARVAMF